MFTLKLVSTCFYILLFSGIKSGNLRGVNVVLNNSYIFSLTVLAIKCYQCSTEKDGKGVDNCGAYNSFDKNQNIAVDCMGEEAVTPGKMFSFLLNKLTLTPFVQAHSASSQFNKDHVASFGMVAGEVSFAGAHKSANEVSAEWGL